MLNNKMLIFKIVPRNDWQSAADPWPGSAHDQADGFLHFSTAGQLAETLRRHYAGQDDLQLLAVEADNLSESLTFELAPARGEAFPHLYGPLPHTFVRWTRPIKRDGDDFALPPLD